MSWAFQPLLPASVVIQADTGGGPSYVGYIKVWDGSQWNYKPVKTWNGSTWEIKPIKFYNGASWTTTSGL